MTLSPVLLFAYARPDHTRRTLEALAKNRLASESSLYAFCDGPKNERAVEKCEETRRIVEEAKGFKDVIVERSQENLGLARSIIRGVTQLVEEHGRAIVVEDDLVSAGGFLEFMNEGLARYASMPQVFTICGYSHPPSLVRIPSDYPYDAFFSYRNMSWGWATWADRWRKADWEVRDYDRFQSDSAAQARFNRGGPDMARMLIDQMEGRLDSWAIRWSYAMFKHDALALLPVHSFIHNIGADSTGTHFKTSSEKYRVDLTLARKVERWPEIVEVDPRIARNFAGAYRRTWKGAIRKAMTLMRRGARA